ncbi:MAG: PQQ-dependent sugar dehydrogenase [Myxococcota bacterium]
MGPSAAETTDPPPVDRLSLPPGFTLSLFSAAVPGARSLARGADGTLYVGTRQESVYAVQDTDGDHVADRVVVIAEGLNMPNGVAVQGEDLYVAEVGRILRWKGIAKKLSRPGKPEVVTDRYPEDRHHGWKFIAFGPDGKLYVPVGAPCNICDPDEPYAALTRINPNGGDFEIVARGIRNTVGFDWRPGTKEIWFTDNGRDHLGDTKPPCELNRITEVGQHFGYPYCHGGDIPDPEFGKKRKCSEFRPPARRLVAHAAPVGMRFYTGKSFPSKYQGRIFVAEHGSWNRSRKVGYRVMTASVDTAGQVVAYEPFISGWLDEEAQQAWGRPVDVLVMPDGALLVSDDRAGAIYRVHHAGT